MTPQTAAHQASLSMEFSRQEYRSGLPFSTPGDLPDPGIKLVSLALAGGFFTTLPSVKPIYRLHVDFILEKAMAPHSSTLAWKIPWKEEPGRLQSMGSLGVGHDCITFK